jgi:hypothetical protein
LATDFFQSTPSFWADRKNWELPEIVLVVRSKVAINTTIEENLVTAQIFWALLEKFSHQLW